MPRRVLLISIDRLGKSFVGPYGNTWLDTPGFNQLAGDSLLCEYPVAESLEVNDFVESILSGRHKIDRDAAKDDAARSDVNDVNTNSSLLDQLRQHSLSSQVISDDPQFVAQLESAGIDQVVELELESSTDEDLTAESVEQTQVFQTLSTAATLLNDPESADFVWVHTTGLANVWDAPFEKREAFHDEEDPDPWTGTTPPSQPFESGDHDEVFPMIMAYAAQVQALDESLHFLLHACQLSPIWRDAMWIITSPRGFPLGEHGRVGDYEESLHAESIDVPLLIRLPESQVAGNRLPSVVQPHSLHHTILSWLQIESESTPTILPSFDIVGSKSLLPQRDGLAVSTSKNEIGLRTWSWYLLASAEQQRLYVKPDDIWEVNDIADRCPDVLEEMNDAIRVLAERSPNSVPQSLKLPPASESKPDESKPEANQGQPERRCVELSDLLKLGYR